MFFFLQISRFPHYTGGSNEYDLCFYSYSKFFLRDSSAESNLVGIQFFNQLHAEVAYIMWTLSNCPDLVNHVKSFSQVSWCKSVQGSDFEYDVHGVIEDVKTLTQLNICPLRLQN